MFPNNVKSYSLATNKYSELNKAVKRKPLHQPSGIICKQNIYCIFKETFVHFFSHITQSTTSSCTSLSYLKSIYSECCIIIWHPPSQLITCRITSCRIIESNYIAKYSSSSINYPLKPVGLWNVGLLGVGISSIHCSCLWVLLIWNLFSMVWVWSQDKIGLATFFFVS